MCIYVYIHSYLYIHVSPNPLPCWVWVSSHLYTQRVSPWRQPPWLRLEKAERWVARSPLAGAAYTAFLRGARRCSSYTLWRRLVSPVFCICDVPMGGQMRSSSHWYVFISCLRFFLCESPVGLGFALFSLGGAYLFLYLFSGLFEFYRYWLSVI